MAQLATSDRRWRLLCHGDHIFEAVNNATAKDTV